MITTKIEGLAELDKALRELPDAIQGRPLRAAVAAGARLIQKDGGRLEDFGLGPGETGRDEMSENGLAPSCHPGPCGHALSGPAHGFHPLHEKIAPLVARGD